MMQHIKDNMRNILLCILELLVGIFLLVDAFKFIAGVFILAGLAMLTVGIVFVVKYFKEEPNAAAKSSLFALGLFALLCGVFFIARFEWLTVLPVSNLMYGGLILVAGLSKVQEAVDMLRLKRQKWFLYAISAALSILCAVIIICNPFVWVFAGIALVVEAVFDTVILFLTYEKSV